MKMKVINALVSLPNKRPNSLIDLHASGFPTARTCTARGVSAPIGFITPRTARIERLSLRNHPDKVLQSE